MENEKNRILSLYDYLGRAAGPELGQEVALLAKSKNITVSEKYISNTFYTGPVMMYPKWFLNQYFNGGN